MPESMAVPLSADHMSIHNSFESVRIPAGITVWRWPTFSPGRDLSRRRTIHMGTASHRTVLHRSVMSREIRIPQAKDYGAVKRAVFLYGGVQTSLYLPAENRGGDGNVCYKGSEEPNHDTVIIGWDDDYPKEKFASAPESDGGVSLHQQLGRNLWDGGFFMSPTRTAGSRRAVSPIAGSSRRIIMTGITRVISADGPVRWAMESRTHGWRTCIQQSRRETLEAVGFYATAPDTEYEVYVFDGDSFREHVENGVKFQVDSGKVLAFGMVTDEGFYTVHLSKTADGEW